MSDLADAWTQAQAWIGMRVEVVLEHGDPNVTQTGRLLSLDEDGNCRIECDSGVTHYCWPLLDVRRLDTCAAEPDGTFWVPQPCERAPGHGSHHVDRHGRTWT